MDIRTVCPMPGHPLYDVPDVHYASHAAYARTHTHQEISTIHRQAGGIERRDLGAEAIRSLRRI